MAIPGYPSAQNSCWNGKFAYAFAKSQHLTIDVQRAKIVRRVSLVDDVTITKREGESNVRREYVKLPRAKKLLTKNSNVLVGDYHYFRSGGQFLIGRVNIRNGQVEYLQVPVQIVRRTGMKDEVLWSQALKNDMKNADGFVASGDKRNAGSGWGHVSAASPTVVGDKIYLPTMIGMVYVLKWDAKELNAEALLSISDLGPATATWSLSSLSFCDGRIYARTLKELICIGSR